MTSLIGSPAGREGVDQLVPFLYGELRRIARRQLRGERPDHTLNTTDLVHEAYVKLIGFDRLAFQNRSHFLAVASQAMRRILVDYAAARNAQKRGGALERHPLDDAVPQEGQPIERLLAVDAALARLEELNPRLTRVVECRVFGGMSIDETAQALDVSAATVKRDWSFARAWLDRELR
jgi:RNA polymerase sigma factor (TIGR02999 family)